LSRTEIYTIKKGDTLTEIAKKYQHRKWETIWDAPENKPLVAKRKKPQLVQPGDQITIPPNEKQQADKKLAEDRLNKTNRTVTYLGRNYTLSEKEFDFAANQFLDGLKQAVLGAQQRTDCARIVWNTFNKLNDDQYIVSWCVGLLGPKLPAEAVIKSAEQAHTKLESALASGNFDRIRRAMKEAEPAVNTAYKTMMEYKKATIGHSETQLGVLNWVSDASFDVLTTLATSELGGTPVAGATAGFVTGAIKSSANEFGKYFAGGSQTPASVTQAIIVDAAIGTLTGALGPLMKIKGDKIVEGVVRVALKKISLGVTRNLAERTVREFLVRRVSGAFKSGFNSAVKNCLKYAKGTTTFEKLCDDIEKDMALGSVLNGLDPFFNMKFAPAVFRNLTRIGLTIPAGETKERFVDALADVLKDQRSELLKKSLESAIEKAHGDESAEELGNEAAAHYAKSNHETLEKAILLRLKK